MEIGNKIKKVRELRNFTQEYVAQKLGITQESYSRIEANRAALTLQRLDKISEVLEVSVFELMSFDEKNVFFNSSETQNNTSIGVFQESQSEKKLYERLIEELKKQLERVQQDNDFLKELVKTLTNKN
jgi:transcriptional regulator with XRE-family HTH domain